MTLEKMKERKIELGLTNEMVAELSGVPLGTVHKIFAGKTKAPRRETLLALEAVLSPACGGVRPTDVRQFEPGNGDQFSSGYMESGNSMVCEPAAAYKAGGSGEDAHRTRAYREGVCDVDDPRQGSYTIEDYYALPDVRRVELIDGWIYDMAAPSRIHQTVLIQLAAQFVSCLKEHPECLLQIAPSDVRLDNDRWTMVQPDLFIVCNSQDNDPQRTNGAPDFIIEILSPSNRYHDMFRKLNKYRLAHVREYWIIDSEKQRITVYDFEHDELPMTYTFGDTVPIGISKGECEVDFSEIYDKVKKYL